MKVPVLCGNGDKRDSAIPSNYDDEDTIWHRDQPHVSNVILIHGDMRAPRLYRSLYSVVGL